MPGHGTSSTSRQAREYLLENRARHHGLRIAKTSARGNARDGYQLVDDARDDVVIGEGFWLTLDDVEAWLRGTALGRGAKPTSRSQRPSGFERARI